MKIVVIGGTGLIGSKVVEKLKHKVTRQLQRRQIRASTRLLAKAWQMRLRALKSSWTWPTRPHSQIKLQWISSRRPARTSRRRKRPPASNITSPSRLSEPSACSTAVISAPNLRKRASSRTRPPHTQSSSSGQQLATDVGEVAHPRRQESEQDEPEGE
jgi:hypothetical protein